jgi:hypothetical protein
LSKLIPKFQLADFVAEDSAPANPYLKTVVRQPLSVAERPIPVGVVSSSYSLIQHSSVVEKCFEGLRRVDIEPKGLKCDLGLTELGEWMNFRVYFGEQYSYRPADGHKLGLRLECFNSVDGSSRLIVCVGWLRLVCRNGIVIWEAQQELKDIHNAHLDLDRVAKMVADSLGKVDADQRRIRDWEARAITVEHLERWSDKNVTEAWGKNAACRVFHICRGGFDVEIADRFVGGRASQKAVKQIAAVPGAAIPARNLYDASQALSWVASNRNNSEERLDWQVTVPSLVSQLSALLD